MVIRRSLFAALALASVASAGPAGAADVVDGPFVGVVGARPEVREVVARPRVAVVRPQAAIMRQAAYGCGCLGLPWGGLRASCAPVVRRVIRTKRVVLSRKG